MCLAPKGSLITVEQNHFKKKGGENPARTWQEIFLIKYLATCVDSPLLLMTTAYVASITI